MGVRKGLWGVAGLRRAIVIGLTIICSLIVSAPIASALFWDMEWTHNPFDLRQGEEVTILMSFRNTEDSPMRIEWFSVNFDWQSEDDYYDVMAEYIHPIILEPGTASNFNFTIKIPDDATLGRHDMQWYIQYSLFEGQGEWTEYSETWNGALHNVIEGIPDRDGDGYRDNIDAFPDDPEEWLDTDSDGVGDNSDDFPEDRREWLDTDKDGVGDNSDAYRDDPSRWEAPAVEAEGNGGVGYGLYSIIGIVIIVLVVALFFFSRRRREDSMLEQSFRKGREKEDGGSTSEVLMHEMASKRRTQPSTAPAISSEEPLRDYGEWVEYSDTPTHVEEPVAIPYQSRPCPDCGNMMEPVTPGSSTMYCPICGHQDTPN